MSNKMQWDKLLCADRFYSGGEAADPGRTSFQKDIDRIIFSSAFRRLRGKTQVHPLPRNDHIHDRLTHTLEVSSVGRTLGQRVGNFLEDQKLLPGGYSYFDVGSIVQAACTAHDIGNPPFGHACEEAIADKTSEWLNKNPDVKDFLDRDEISDLLAFDGNAQGFRLLTRLEHHQGKGGMRLTHATLGTFLKYPNLSNGEGVVKDGKFSVFFSELANLKSVVHNCGMLQKGKYSWARHPLAYLVEAADDICYQIIDIEDGIELGILQFSDYEELLDTIGLNSGGQIGDISPGQARFMFFEYRGKIFDALIEAAFSSFKENYNEIMCGSFQGSLLERKNSDVQALLSKTASKAQTRLFTERNKILMEIGVYESMDLILSRFFECVREYIVWNNNGAEPRAASKKVLEHVRREGFALPSDAYSSYRGAIDYVAGMTDSYATYTSKTLYGIGF